LEETVGQLADDNLIVEAYVLDAIGSSVAESLADLLQDKIRDEAHSHGLCISRRFSPGYCDWDISQQEMVFPALNGDSSGVFLSDEFMMTPQKSISGIIGIGLCDSGMDSFNPCKTCNKRNCPGRRH
jgi:cobalamin-dependent methionine synthase I